MEWRYGDKLMRILDIARYILISFHNFRIIFFFCFRCLKKLKDTFVDELLRKYDESAIFNLKKYSQSKSVFTDKTVHQKKLKT